MGCLAKGNPGPRDGREDDGEADGLVRAGRGDRRVESAQRMAAVVGRPLLVLDAARRQLESHRVDRRLPGALRDGAVRVAGPPVELVRNAHSGIVGDYLLWIVARTPLIGGIWASTLP